MSWNDTERKPDIALVRKTLEQLTDKKPLEAFERVVTSYDDEIENMGYEMMGDDL